MKISLLCSDVRHPINAYLAEWMKAREATHAIELVRKKSELTGGDLLFLISCGEMIAAQDRAKYRASLVLHASDLPAGRGWSPHIWEISRGAESITLSMIEAQDKVDTGRIWHKIHIPIPKHALWDEINQALFEAEIASLDFAIAHIDHIQPITQEQSAQGLYYRRRNPDDSRIDPSKGIAEQFDLIRVCDPNRYPAFFDHLGHRYVLKLEKFDEQQ